MRCRDAHVPTGTAQEQADQGSGNGSFYTPRRDQRGSAPRWASRISLSSFRCGPPRCCALHHLYNRRRSVIPAGPGTTERPWAQARSRAFRGSSWPPIIR
jgi:hypothetical protein